jgi:Na+/melibiose symporter-like transporter
LAVVAGVGSLLAMVANPFFGRMSDRTSSHLGIRRPGAISFGRLNDAPQFCVD